MNITRRELLAAAPAAFASRGSAQEGSRPNILLVLADDLAAWMLGCYGNQEIRTPNIDLLARSGMRFLNSYVATPVCSASRATLFTGRLPSQHGIHDFLTANPIADPPQGQKEPPASFKQEAMISDLLAQQGYRCGYIGKWHMGEDVNPQHRYEYWCTTLGQTYQDPRFSVNGKELQEKGFLTDLLTGRALEFLDQQPADKPFFLVTSYLNPHLPYSGHPEKYYKMYENVSFDKSGWEHAAPNALREKELLQDTVGNIRKCAASVTALDDQIPRLLAKLDEKKLRDNTLIVFTGDNGFLLGRHGLWSKGLASNPINMFEEVMQVPMIWNWRGKTPPESTRPELISFYDFLPSICEATGTPVPPDRKLIGRSYVPLAFGQPFPKKAPRWTELAYGQYRNTEMIRDRRYKLIVRNQGAGPNELYDLNTDKRERLNQYENPQFVTVRDRLAAELPKVRARAAG
jgi:arylsulfatase A-like enzyme